jgi:hypothetical protein
MSKVFGSGKAAGGDPTKMAAPANLSGLDPDKYAALQNIDTSYGMQAEPMPSNPDGTGSNGAPKKKKLDWRNMVQQGIAGAQSDDEDPMAVLARMQGNESSYMNRPMY